MAVQASTLLTQHGKGSLSVHLIYVLLLQEHFMPVMYTQNKKKSREFRFSIWRQVCACALSCGWGGLWEGDRHGNVWVRGLTFWPILFKNLNWKIENFSFNSNVLNKMGHS